MSMLYEKNLDPQQVQIGQRVHCILYGGRDGVIYNINGQQDPASVRSLGGGCIVMGGRASFDVVFEDGTESRGVPESIVRGVQWRILPEIANAEEIATLRGSGIGRRTSGNANSSLVRTSDEERHSTMSEAEDYITNHWPKEVPNDCTKLDRNEADCLERNLPQSEWCESCVTYNRLLLEMPEEAQ